MTGVPSDGKAGAAALGAAPRDASTIGFRASGALASRSALKIFIAAGEESGDRLGAALMAAIAAYAQGPVAFAGIGGAAMTERGLASLFPIDELAINGFVAVPARLPLIFRRIRETAATVIAARPDVLVIVDSPDFTHRVARRVRAAAPEIPIIDYVSPTIWAWRPGRAAAMRRYIDHVLALLPFEPEAHRALGGPPCTFVGHPLAEAVATLRPDAVERARREAAPPVILVLPGSRSGEIFRHLATFGRAIALVRERIGAEIVLPTVPHLFDRVARETAAWPVAPQIVVEPARKWAAFRQARAALAASGTVTLELALAQVPSVIAYKVALVEEVIARMVATTRTIGLANIILGETVMPELLQRQASPPRLAEALVAIIGDTPARRRQLDAFARLDAIMEIGDAAPSARAAAIVLDMARMGRQRRPDNMIGARVVGSY
jgi:lipid-A-disaccharide synthase